MMDGSDDPLIGKALPGAMFHDLIDIGLIGPWRHQLPLRGVEIVTNVTVPIKNRKGVKAVRYQRSFHTSFHYDLIRDDRAQTA